MVEANGPHNPDDEVGVCQVCLTLIEEQVKICPSCSAIICQGCINRLLQDNCPNCRSNQAKDSYVRVRALEEIIKTIKIRKISMTCGIHGHQKTIYCMNEGCKIALCPECFIDSHMNH